MLYQVANRRFFVYMTFAPCGTQRLGPLTSVLSDYTEDPVVISLDYLEVKTKRFSDEERIAAMP